MTKEVQPGRPTERRPPPHLLHVCKLHCIISGASTEFKWLSCFDSLIIQMKGLAGKKDSVPDSLLVNYFVSPFLARLPSQNDIGLETNNYRSPRD